MMNKLKHIATALADAFIAGESHFEALLFRGRYCLGIDSGNSPNWLKALCQHLMDSGVMRKSGFKHRQLVDVVYHFKPFRRAWKNGHFSNIVRYLFPEGEKFKQADFIRDNLPALSSSADLCTFFGLDAHRLIWLSDPWYSQLQTPKACFQHYRYQSINKSREGSYRLLEKPKYLLKNLQQTLNSELLAKIPMHPCAHGFRKGHSTLTYTKNHLAKCWLLKLDLSDFFLSIGYARVFAIFLSLGYPEIVARQLTLLCTNRIPLFAFKHIEHITWWQKKRFFTPHLPQGAPSSPALSNLAAFNLDCRLKGLADSISANYSRYADDMVFSSNRYVNMQKLIPLIGHIVQEEGFQINYHKTRVMGQGQQQKVAGIVVNKHHNIDRREYDKIKAILHNCRTRGVTSQMGERVNFHSWLKGKISYIHSVNPEKGCRLMAVFKQLEWPND